MLEIKREQEPIYIFNSETTPREYGRMVKHFPKYYWLNVRNATILNLGIIGLNSLIGNYDKRGLISLFLFLEILVLIIYKVRFEDTYEKSFINSHKKYHLDTYFTNELYEDYFIRISEQKVTKLLYRRITKTVETDTNFYIEIDGGLIALQKDKCTDEILEFLRGKCRENLSVAQKKKVIENVKNPEVLRIVMTILFVLTCICIPLTLSFINKVSGNQNLLEVLKNYWVFWLWLPIPIVSIILGFKYRKVRNAYDANIIVGFIVGILLSLFGCFCLLQIVEDDYIEFFKQEEIIDDGESCHK